MSWLGYFLLYVALSGLFWEYLLQTAEENYDEGEWRD